MSALGSTITLAAGQGSDGGDALRFEADSSVAGLDTFSYVASDGNGGTSSATVSIDVTDLGGLRPPDNVGTISNNLIVDYYVLNNPSVLPDFDGLTPYASGFIAALNSQSTNGNFLGSGRSDDVGAVFTGVVEIFEPAEYTFYLESDDGSRMLIGDQVVVETMTGCTAWLKSPA